LLVVLGQAARDLLGGGLQALLGVLAAGGDQAFTFLGCLVYQSGGLFGGFPDQLVGLVGGFLDAPLRLGLAGFLALAGCLGGLAGALFGLGGRLVDHLVGLVGGFADAPVGVLGAFLRPSAGFFGAPPCLGLAGPSLLR